jgi:hypothetical protein
LSAGGGGISDAPNDGLAYTRKSLAWAQSSPYDLKQEGATDGQVLAWSTANSRFQPTTPSAGSSKWTDITGGIYRGGPVGIAANSSDGITTLVTNVALSLKAFNTGRANRQILRGYDNADVEVFAIDNTGAIYSSAAEGYWGNPTTKTANQFKFRLQGNGASPFFLVTNQAETVNAFQINGTGIVVGTFESTSSQFWLGNPTSPVAGSFSYKSTNNGARLFAIQNGSNAIRLELLGTGQLDLYATAIFRINSPVSPNSGFSYKGPGNITTTSNFQLQNANGTVGFEMFGGGRICMYQVLAVTSDPLRAGELWNDLGTLKISAG